jgi:hypothetical protein
MNNQQETPTTDMSTQGQVGPDQGNKAINIEKLAEKVYQLMRAEARLGRARGQTRRIGR